MYQIKQGRKSFYIGIEPEPLAEMTFVNQGEGLITIDGTYVDENLRGQGIGYKLLDALTDYARQEGKKIIPLCPFAKAGWTKTIRLLKMSEGSMERIKAFIVSRSRRTMSKSQ